MQQGKGRAHWPVWAWIGTNPSVPSMGESGNMKIRLPRQRGNERQPEYLNARDETWLDQDKRRGGQARFRRAFGRIIVLCVILLIIIIMAIVSATTKGSTTVTNQQTAGETYAISTETQNQLRSTTEDFIYGMLLLSYCSDKNVAQEGKDMALSTMALGCQSYDLVSAMEPGEGKVKPDDLEVVIGGIGLEDGTRAYQGSYTYEGRGGVANKNKTDDDHPDGTLVDNGYSFKVSFSQVTDENGENPIWKISYAKISRA